MISDLFHPFSELASVLLPRASGSDGSHDLSHLTRVWRNVREIQCIEGGDLEILAAAVLLHDCVDVPKNSPLRSQASKLAASEASQQLLSLGWSERRTAWVASAIESHSFSAGIEPTTLEACILQDADRLDAIGFIGIARCFYTAGRLGSSLYAPSDPGGVDRPLSDATFALDHFSAKLLGLATSFRTATGQDLAAQRQETLRGFYLGFLAEIA